MTYQPPIPPPLPGVFPFSAPAPITSSAPTVGTFSPTAAAPPPETRTLLTFPIEGLPAPRLVSPAALRAFPVRYPSGSPPAQTQVNRWLCCRCADEGYLDPVGMVHYSCPLLLQGSASSSAVSPVGYHHLQGGQAGYQGVGQPMGRGRPGGLQHDGYGQEQGQGHGHGASDSGGVGGSEEEGFGVCWRASCRHRKCVNCALYAGPLGRDPKAKLLIRTVGGLYASPRFVDPVYWECGECGEWARNRFDSRCTLGVTGCRNEGCVFAWQAGRGSGVSAGVGLVRGPGPGSGPQNHLRDVGGGVGVGVGVGVVGCAPFSVAGAGTAVLTAESVVMNRYGERLGTADQRIAAADGPWDWQRRALGDARCAIVAGLRAAMRRMGEGMEVGAGVEGNRRSRGLGRAWHDGESVPRYPYRRPPPVDENDTEENNEYEGSYLAGMPMDPMDKGKGVEQQLAASGQALRFCSAPSPVPGHAVALNSVPAGSSSSFFSGWNHLQM